MPQTASARAVPSVPSAGFGPELRRWREARRVSQLELGLTAEVSARHVSFLETGRARPSAAMVLTLAEALDVPLGARNDLLLAAGFAPRYPEGRLGEAALALPAAMLGWMLDRHAPLPGFALDRHWRIVRANAPATGLLAAVGLGEGASLLDASRPGTALRAAIRNWPLVARYLADRLATEIRHLGSDPVLEAALAAIEADAATAGPQAAPPALLPVVYGLGDVTLSFVSTIAHFGAASDLALVDLRIELLFPADAATAAAFGVAPMTG